MNESIKNQAKLTTQELFDSLPFFNPHTRVALLSSVTNIHHLLTTSSTSKHTSIMSSTTRNGQNASFPFKLSNLPLRPSTLSLLTRRGFNSTADIFASKRAGGISNLAAELDVPLVEAAGIVREIEQAVKSLSSDSIGQGSVEPGEEKNAPQTAASILSSQYNHQGLRTRPIISFAQSIDSLLGGGFQPKEVSEIVGMPGVGKSQLAMQLCVDTKLPKGFGGVEGHSVYIDSEGSFSPERCYDMAKALVNHLQGSVQRSNGKKRFPENYSAETIMDSIHVFRVYDETSQSATIQSMPEFMKKMEDLGCPIKLLVVDSIAFHYRVRVT